MPTAISLFTGCGGSDTGISRAGFDIVMANDILPYARDVYMSNLPETDYILGDISQITSFPTADLLVGCYPCQGFSQGGLRVADRKINRLYLEFARALTVIQPKAFIVENVSGLLRRNFAHLLQDQFKVFGAAGYNITASILNAADYGVPQKRKRIFIVGIRKKYRIKYTFPAPLYGPTGSGLRPYRTIRDTIGSFPLWPEGEFYDSDFHWYYMSRNRRQDWDQVSKTIVANPRHMPLHPISPKLEKIAEDCWRFCDSSPARRFSYREAAALQGFHNLFFPDTKHSNMIMRYTVVGNAVPPPLFEAVTNALPDLWND